MRKRQSAFPPVSSSPVIDFSALKLPEQQQQQQQPVNEYVWRNEKGDIVEPPPAQPLPQFKTQRELDAYVASQHRKADEAWGWWWFWIFIGFIFFILLLSLLAYPRYARPYPYPLPPPPPPFPVRAGIQGRGRNNCTLDEVFSEVTQMCMMKVHFPHAVAPDIIDTKVAPCADMYRHACGRWIDAHTNENRGFSGLTIANGATLRSIIGNDTAANLHPFFQACVATLIDPRAANKKRAVHLSETRLSQQAILGRMLDPLVSTDDLPIVFARMAAAGFTNPIALVMQRHPMAAGLVPMFTYDGFTASEQDRDFVRMHFELLHGDVGPKADQEAVRFIDMVTRLSVARPDPEGRTDTYSGWQEYVSSDTGFKRDLVTWGEFKGRRLSLSTFDWDAYIGELEKRLSFDKGRLHFTDKQKVWAFSRAYFEWWHPEHFSVEDWRTFVTFSVLYHTHDFFPTIPADILLTAKGGRRPLNVVSPLRSPHRRLKKRRLSLDAYRLHPERRDRRRVPSPYAEDEGIVVTREDCIDATKYMLPGLLSKEFLARTFTPSSEDGVRKRVKQMTERIRDRFVANILATPWLAANTTVRDAQAEKIRAIVPRVMQPAEWTEERFPLGKEMDPSRYLRNLLVIQEEHVRRNLLLWSESNYGAHCDSRCRDHITFWGAPLFTVNAWYNPDRNVITIPAGILQPPFFHEEYTDASAYGTIGWVIAHELSHAMDANGILYDKDGVMRDTWSPDTLREYRRRAAYIVREYGSPEGCTNEAYGKQTLCEDIADINGLRLAYEALFLDTLSPAMTTTADKKEFFMAASQMWCASYTPDVLCDQARDDVHAVAAMRVRKTEAHLPYFAETFQCAVGSPMHRQDHERFVLFGREATTPSSR